MTSKPQMPDCTSTSFTNVIYTKLTTFPSRKISRIMHPFSTQTKSAIHSSLPLLPLAKQTAGATKKESKIVHHISLSCIMVTGSKGSYPSSPIKSTSQIQTMRTYQNLGWSAAFLSAVFFADAFFVSTISIADFGHAAFGHSPVQQ